MYDSYKILIVDDEPDTLEFLSYNLCKEGYRIYVASNGKNAIELVKKKEPNLILLDMMMPDMDGIETCRKIRRMSETKHLSIAFLTARHEDYSQIAGFEAGGDDYIIKPIRLKVLIYRINALLKRYKSIDEDINIQNRTKVFGNMSIDEEAHIVRVNEKQYHLPKKEFIILQLLTSRPSKVVTRKEIFESICSENVYVGDRNIDVYIHNLREKLGQNRIMTIMGIGFKFL
jgi:two-component system, OmpR family, alkaline phosphatase synthesis response regulator PhoP